MKRVYIGVVSVLLIVGCVLWVVRENRSHLAVANVQKLGGTVIFSHIGPNWLSKVLGHPYSLKRVKEVWLMGASITDGDLSVLRPFHNVEVVMLNGSSIDGAGLTNLTGTAQLKELYLTKSRVSDDGLKYVKRLQGLKKLSLAGTGITDNGLAHLGTLSSLVDLNLEGTQISDTGLGRITGVSLRELNVRDTKVTASTVALLNSRDAQLHIIH